MWAQRFGDVNTITFTRAGLAAAMYHAGDWDAAIALTDELANTTWSRFAAAYARGVRAMMTLARGDFEGSLEDAQAVLDYSGESANEEGLLVGHVLLARIRHAQGRLAEGDDESQEILAHWQDGHAIATMASTLAELTPIASQRTALGRAAELLPEGSRWKDALRAVGAGRDAEAADRFAAIGSRPLEAAACLLAARAGGAGADDHAQRARAIYDELGATLYAAQATALVRASA